MANQRISISLILLAQTGDLCAFEQLLKEIERPLFHYIAKLANDSHFAEDILQDVFVLVWRKIGYLRDPELFVPWVYRIASREVFRRLKHEKRWQHRVDPVSLEALAIDTPHQPVEWNEAFSALLSVVSPASRAVLVLHYERGMSLEDIAAVLELSPGTVKSRLAYGLSVLRQKLSTGEFNGPGV